MRDHSKSMWGWIFILAFLGLPNCSFEPAAVAGPNLFPGPPPRNSLIFCDIEDKSLPRRCATPADAGVPLAQAAIALTRDLSSNIGFDFSPAARAALGCGDQPVAVFFKGPFPKGTEVCLNCGFVIGPGSTYPDASAACVAKCQDLNGVPEGKNPPDADVVDFCASHAAASTNAGNCFDGACTDAGLPLPEFVDPRRTPEAVQWTNLIGTATGGAESNTLTRTAPTSVPSAFDAGAASVQTLTRGDGYAEFTAVETNRTRAIGLATGASPDADPSLADIDFALSLSSDGHVFTVENGAVVPGPNPDSSWASYASGDRLRVMVTDRLDGTADVKYFLVPASCAGAGCDGMLLRTGGPAAYPFRVDASLREQGAALTDARIVRIK